MQRFFWLYFSLSGRIPRRTYWLATLAMLCVSIPALLAVIALVAGDPFAIEFWEQRPEAVSLWGPVFLGYQLALSWPALALGAKRLQDRGRPGWIYLVYVIANFALVLLQIAGNAPGDGGRYASLYIVLLLSSMIFGLWLLVELGFLRGERGSNRYGPDPLPETPPPIPGAPAGRGFLSWMFGFNGRIGRGAWWGGAGIVWGAGFGGLVVLVMIFGVMATAIGPQKLEDPNWIATPEGQEFFTRVGLIAGFWMMALIMIGLWPTLALGVKRLHDRNMSGWWMLLLFGPFLAASMVSAFEDSGALDAGFSLKPLFWLAALASAVWGIVQLGILPGSRGDNDYGPDPTPPAPYWPPPSPSDASAFAAPPAGRD